ncbi:hypothetical protein ACPUER_09615 [Burkholderia sp. DN3021]|uniref:hypothetical protein n=1 Tax=Burkholderia sp. DN3021 TaxID=3410137 RepID=UPI003C7B4BA3
MDIDELLTVEERKDDGTGSLETGRLRGVRCAGAYLRAINGTLRAAVPIRLRTGRARFAAQTARERNWKPCHATPGAAPVDGLTMERRATPMQLGNLDRPKSCVKRRLRHPAHSSERTRGSRQIASHPPIGRHACQRIPIRTAQCLTATSAHAAWQRVVAARY